MLPWRRLAPPRLLRSFRCRQTRVVAPVLSAEPTESQGFNRVSGCHMASGVENSLPRLSAVLTVSASANTVRRWAWACSRCRRSSPETVSSAPGVGLRQRRQALGNKKGGVRGRRTPPTRGWLPRGQPGRARALLPTRFPHSFSIGIDLLGRVQAGTARSGASTGVSARRKINP